MESNYRKFGGNEIEWTKCSMNLNGLCNMGEIVQVLDTDCVIGLCIDGIRNDCNFEHICFRNE